METPLSISDLINRHDSVRTFFQTKWEEGEENERYKRAENWSESQKKQIIAQNRIPYSISLMNAKANQVIAYQRNNRTEFKLKATIDPNDDIKAELGNIQFKDFEKQNDFQYIEGDVFDSGVTVKYGVVGIYLDKDNDYRDYIKVREIDYRNFVWDTNAVSYSKNDALFMAELEKVYRYQIEAEYGKIKSKALAQGETYEWGRNKDTYYISPDENSSYDIITKFTHYEKVLRTYYCVLFNDYQNFHNLKDSNVVGKFKSKKEAERRLRELQIPYLMEGLELGNSDVIKEVRQQLDKYIFTIDDILEYEETELEDFPYAIYQAYHFKDQFWSLTDLLKSMQKFIDRYISQIDYSFGKDIKNVYELAVNQLADGLNYEKALEIIEESGVLPVKTTGVIKAVRVQGINPQWLQMVQVMQSFLEDLSGGRSFQGLSEGANESGKSVLAKQQQGELIASLFIDNLRRWKRDLGKKLLWWFNKYDTVERLVKVGGGEITPEMAQFLQSQGLYTPSVVNPNEGYAKVNTPMFHLKDAKVELVVTENPLSENRKAQKFAQLATVAQITPQIVATPEFTGLLLETLDIDYSTRQKILTALNTQMQQQQQMAAQQADFEQQKLNVEKAKALISDKGQQVPSSK